MSSHRPTFSAFDPADYLNSFDDVVAYLEAVIDEGEDDPTLITQARCHRPVTEPECDRPPGRHEPRGSLQGTVGRR